VLHILVTGSNMPKYIFKNHIFGNHEKLLSKCNTAFLSVCLYVGHSKNAVGSTSSFGRTGSERKCSHTRISHFCFHFFGPPLYGIPIPQACVHTLCIPTVASVDKTQSVPIPILLSRFHWRLFMAKVFGGVCFCWAPSSIVL